MVVYIVAGLHSSQLLTSLAYEALLVGPPTSIRTYLDPAEAEDALWLANDVDLLITDMHTKGDCHHGLNLIKTGKEIHPELVAVLMAHDITQHVKAVNPNAVVRKPFSRATMVTAIKQALGIN